MEGVRADKGARQGRDRAGSRYPHPKSVVPWSRMSRMSDQRMRCVPLTRQAETKPQQTGHCVLDERLFRREHATSFRVGRVPWAG